MSHQKALKNTQIAVNKMIRERDAGLACITCDGFHQLYAGHFRTSTHTTTRFHPHNLHGQCNSCNSFNGGMTYEYGLAIDRKYGEGWAAFLTKLARAKENWTTEELSQLRSAARMGYPVFLQLYRELRPHHFCPAPRVKEANGTQVSGGPR
jgi:hypothetical protein